MASVAFLAAVLINCIPFAASAAEEPTWNGFFSALPKLFADLCVFCND